MEKKIVPLLTAFALLIALVLPLQAHAQAAESDFVIEAGVLVKYNGSGAAVTIPSNVTSIGSWAFIGCTELTGITIPQSVKSIGEYAFADCTALTSITIPTSVTAISRGLFYNCTALTGVTIPNSVTSIGDGAFSNCTALTNITIPSSVTMIGIDIFSCCERLANVSIPDSITSISNGAFYLCEKLTSIVIPNSVVSIGANAFGGSGLTSITIPNSVISIGENAFNDCDGLTSVTIPNSVTSIGGGVFGMCFNLSKIQVDAGNKNYISVDGVVYTRDMRKLVAAPNAGINGAFTIPNSVISIGEGAFYGCSGMTGVTIPNSVTLIDSSAFDGCYSLTSVVIPNSVKSIGRLAFYCCFDLTNITIPSSVTSIGDAVFDWCDKVTIYGAAGSAAESHAKENGIPFVAGSVPSAPQVPVLTAVPTASTVVVNGVNMAFDAYEINGNNYFKLRDLAYVLSGSQKQFEVTWNGTYNIIMLTSGAAYTPVGGEMQKKGAGSKTPKSTASTIFIDSVAVDMTAYEIDGNNYFKLREIGEAFDFDVTWDGAKNTIVIDTAKGYTAD